jgi:uncharacterized protein (DUF1778 family)
MKNNYIKLRVNDIEKALLEANAKALGLTISDYLRLCCLTYPPKVLKRKMDKVEQLVINRSNGE